VSTSTELLERDLVGLSGSDHKLSTSGESLALQDVMFIDVYDDDVDDDGKPDNLVASGVVERNLATTGWARNIKWFCRIDAHGIRHESDVGREGR
jgi:hypothetical protein